MSTTVYDDVFCTIVEKYPQLCLPLINEAFSTKYLLDEEVTQMRNEFQNEDGERITDFCLRIRDKVYHIKCQSRSDDTMSVHLIEYDFKIAMDGAKVGQYELWMEFPRSCVQGVVYEEESARIRASRFVVSRKKLLWKFLPEGYVLALAGGEFPAGECL